MDKGVGALGDSIGECRQRGVADIGRDVLDDEERHQRMAQFGLSRAFRPEQIEDGEMLRVAHDDVTEQRGQQEAQSDFGVVAEHIDEFHGVVVERDRTVVHVDEVPLKLEELGVIPVDRRKCRQIVVALFSQTHDTEVIHRMPFGVENTVAEGEEALALPSELAYLHSRLGGEIKKPFQCHKLIVLCEPKVIAESFYALFELRYRNEFLGMEFNDFGLMVDVCNLIQADGRHHVLDVEQRFHGEVRPFAGLAVAVDRDIAVSLLLEAVFLKKVKADGHTRVLDVRLGTLPLGTLDGVAPHGFAGHDLVERVDIHGELDLILHMGNQPGDVGHGVALVSLRRLVVDTLAGIPKDEVLLVNGVKDLLAGAEAVRVVLLPTGGQGNLLDSDLKAILQGFQSVCDDG